MKSDRELLELAAKAAGLNVKGEWADEDDKFTHLNIGKKFTNERMKWNPLTDDGDALRLAVKLKIDTLHRREVWATIAGKGLQLSEAFDEDPNAATRRAITRAAAEIGMAMK